MTRKFILLADKEPYRTGKYEVITSVGRVIEAHYEWFMNLFEIEPIVMENEKVIAWRQIK